MPAEHETATRRHLFEVAPGERGQWWVRRLAEGGGGGVKVKAFGPYANQAVAEQAAEAMRLRRDWLESAAVVGAVVRLDSAGELHAVELPGGNGAASVTVDRHAGGIRVRITRDGAEWLALFEGRR